MGRHIQSTGGWGGEEGTRRHKTVNQESINYFSKIKEKLKHSQRSKNKVISC